MHFPLVSSAGERLAAAEGSPPFKDGSLGKLLEKEKNESVVAEAL